MGSTILNNITDTPYYINWLKDQDFVQNFHKTIINQNTYQSQINNTMAKAVKEEGEPAPSEENKGKKCFRDLKIGDEYYQTIPTTGMLSVIKVTSLVKYDDKRVVVNGSHTVNFENTLHNATTFIVYLDKDEAEFSIIEGLEKKLEQEVKDLVIREQSLKEKTQRLEELKNKFKK